MSYFQENPTNGQFIDLVKAETGFQLSPAGNPDLVINFNTLGQFIDQIIDAAPEDQLAIARMCLRVQGSTMTDTIFGGIANLMGTLRREDEAQLIEAILEHPNCDEHTMDMLHDRRFRCKNPDVKQFLKTMLRHETPELALEALQAEQLGRSVD